MSPQEYKNLVLSSNQKKPKRKNNLVEDAICQNQILPFLTLMKNSKKLPDTIWWAKMTNEIIGGSDLLRIKQWRMGKVAGLPDYMISWGNQYGWIEVKQPGKKQSDSQIAFEKDCIRRGVPYNVVHSMEELEIALKQWGILK